MDVSERGVCIVTQPARNETEKMHAHALANILAEITHVVILTANLDEGSELREHDVIEYSREGAGSGVIVSAFRFALNQLKICQRLLRRDEDFVLFFGATSYVIPALFARVIGKTVIMEPRGNVPLTLRLRWEEQIPVPVARFLAGLVATLEQISYRTAHEIITYTPSMAEELGLEKYKHKLHTNGARYVDTDQFRLLETFEDREDAIGYVGRLDEEKGIRELAEVAKRVDCRFIFVGDGTDREWLENELSEEITAGRVEITGWVEYDEVPVQMNRLRLLLLRSEPTEGLPTVILEAFACGTPVYANPVSGVPDVVRDGKTGFLMIEKSSNQIVYRISYIFAEEDLAAMSDHCRDLVKEKYGFNGSVERYTTILKEISENN